MNSIFKLVFTPYMYEGGFERKGTPETLAAGTLEKCRSAWTTFVTNGHFYGVEATPERYEAIGLLHKLGVRYSVSIGRTGLLALWTAPELVEDPSYSVRPAAERDAWVSAGDTLEDAETVMRNMGESDSRLLILRNNENGALAVYQANGLGYLDFKGTHEQFYGVRP